MYQGMGDVSTTVQCPYGTDASGNCLTGPPNIGPNIIATSVQCEYGTDSSGNCLEAPASSSNPLASVLSAFGASTIPASTNQTFAEWVQANSALIMVAIAAFGGFIALLSFASGKK